MTERTGVELAVSVSVKRAVIGSRLSPELARTFLSLLSAELLGQSHEPQIGFRASLGLRVTGRVIMRCARALE